MAVEGRELVKYGGLQAGLQGMSAALVIRHGRMALATIPLVRSRVNGTPIIGSFCWICLGIPSIGSFCWICLVSR